MLKLLGLTLASFAGLGVIGLAIERQGSRVPINQAVAVIKESQRVQEALIRIAHTSPRNFAIHCRGPRGFVYSRQLDPDGRFTIEFDLHRYEQSYVASSEWADALKEAFVKVGCGTATLDVGSTWAVDLRLDNELRIVGIGEPYYVD